MKRSAITVRLEPELQRLLDKVCKQSGRTRSDILRDALKRQLPILRFEQMVTDESGKLTVNLAPRRYEIAVTSPGYRSREQSVEVRGGMGQSVRIILEPVAAP